MKTLFRMARVVVLPNELERGIGFVVSKCVLQGVLSARTTAAMGCSSLKDENDAPVVGPDAPIVN